MKTSQLSGQPAPLLTIFMGKKFLLTVSLNLSCFNIRSQLLRHTLLWRTWLCSTDTFPRGTYVPEIGTYGCYVPEKPSLHQAEQAQLPQLQHLFTGHLVQTWLSCWPPLSSLQFIDIFSAPGPLEWAAVGWMWTNKYGVQEDNHFIQSTGCVSPDTAQECCWPLLLQKSLLAQLNSTHCPPRSPGAFPAELLPIQTLLACIMPSYIQGFAFCPCWVTQNCQPSPLACLDYNPNLEYMNQAPLKVSCADLMRVHSVTSSRSLIKMLNKAGPNTNVGSTPGRPSGHWTYPEVPSLWLPTTRHGSAGEGLDSMKWPLTLQLLLLHPQAFVISNTKERQLHCAQSKRWKWLHLSLDSYLECMSVFIAAQSLMSAFSSYVYFFFFPT